MDPHAEAAVGQNFMAAYMATGHLRLQADSKPASLNLDTVRILGTVLRDTTHSHQPLATLLYREAASGLTSLMTGQCGPPLNQAAHDALMESLKQGSLKSRMAAAEAMGCLPVRLEGKAPETEDPDRTPLLNLEALAAETPARAGRSLIFTPGGPGRLLVVKLAREHEDPAGLALEAAWLRALGREDWPCRFDVPEAVEADGACLFRLRNAKAHAKGFAPHPEGFAMAYLAHPDYFSYPNQPGDLPGPGDLVETMGRCARLLGLLGGRGILHNAVIPLFHNRTQQGRRDDAGLYQWHRLGRLDRWLESCRHPNFGPTGLRDFEHFEALVRPGRGLFRLAGAQILSLALAAGSYFRARDPELRGLDQDGRPVDARPLFDHALLKRILDTVAEEYFLGFCGTGAGGFDLDTDAVAGRMIEEMGVDRHMTEQLRTMDQERMTGTEFRSFLMAGGVAPETAGAMAKGEKEIQVLTGPHLGHFNGKTSLPELNEYAALAAGRAISGLCLQQRK